MFKRLYNKAKISYKLSPETALLIKSQETIDPALPDMSFVRMSTPWGETIYIPGSSIKGVFRATSEAILKTFGKKVCNSVEPRENCGGKEKKNEHNIKEDEKLPYKFHCWACKTYGSTEMAGRVCFSDLYPWEENDAVEKRKQKVLYLLEYTSIRPGVSIDRKKGNVKAGPFEMEILTGGELFGSITFTNYQLWQVGMILKVIEMANDGLVKFGYAKSRGPGRVKIDITGMEFLQTGPLLDKPLSGTGEIENLRKEYGLVDNDSIPDYLNGEEDGIFKKFKIGKEDKNIIDNLIKKFKEFLEKKEEENL
jgi:CRISPR-associated RAMP protein (TIGR02581 family)